MDDRDDRIDRVFSSYTLSIRFILSNKIASSFLPGQFDAQAVQRGNETGL